MPVWQEVREELHPKGVEVVTVALDRAEDALPWIEKANARHPCLIDEHHTLDERFGVVNVPSGIWIDENGIIVRPPEAAFPGKSMFREIMRGVEIPADADPYIVKSLGQSKNIKVEPEKYLNALRDWADNGAASPYALSPDEVVARSKPMPAEYAEAAAHFELGQHYQRAGEQEHAIGHFKAAHKLEPGNWTYKRQAWQYVSPLLQNAKEVYGTSWADEIEARGADRYYNLADL